MHSFKNKKGLSAIGLLVSMSILGFVLLVGSKLLPYYSDNRFVVSTLKALASDPELLRMAPSEIRTKLAKKFKINNVRGKAAESLKIIKNSKKILITIAYEERVNLLKNIDVVLTFNNVLDTTKPDKCCHASQ